MATKTNTPPAAAVSVAPRLPFRVLVTRATGQVEISEPLDELPARLLVRGALNAGEQATIVENHAPRHRSAEALFAAARHVTIASVYLRCTCGYTAEEAEIDVRLVPLDPPEGDSRDMDPPRHAPRVSPETNTGSSLRYRQVQDLLVPPLRPDSWPALGALALGAAAAVAVRLLVQLAIGGRS